MNSKKSKTKYHAARTFSTKTGEPEATCYEDGHGDGGWFSLPGKFFSDSGTRETVESVVVAFILAFLFRTFEAEAFVIPTGSMAPTLQGRHKDVECPECEINYRAGASQENPDQNPPTPVLRCVCPNCGFVMDCTSERSRNQHDRMERTYSGDRILVSKLAYEIDEPERWDVIVFKYPGNAKMNYIKRLVGLPNETVKLQYGDVFVKSNEGNKASEFRIARKPPEKIQAMLQLVHDNQHEAKKLIEEDWPKRWSTEPVKEPSEWKERELPSDHVKSGRVRQQWSIDSKQTDKFDFIRYHHYTPNTKGNLGWRQASEIDPQRASNQRASNIEDFYEYNMSMPTPGGLNWVGGLAWVGDLALEASVEILSDAGQLRCELVEGGHFFVCDFNVETGSVTLSIDEGKSQFVDIDEQPDGVQRVADTKMKGPGGYEFTLANIDDQLVLWINGSLVEFDGPTAYAPLDNHKQKKADLAPVGLGACGVSLKVNSLRVHRDVYYLPVKDDYRVSYDTLRRNSNRQVEFKTGDGHFFVLGDNSPASKDSRLWKENPGDRHYVERKLLIGKALFIYWPHARTDLFPMCPNFSRMGFVR
ncbi:MAG: signal peptidase I [Planctomycetaceae bacterium]|nr:signal peptidase I [Planctomycetaceae bacterium]